MESPRIVEPAYSKTLPVPPPMPMREMRLRIMSLGSDPRLQRAFHLHFVGLRLALQQALRCEHVFHLAGADAKSESSESAMSGGMAVAADYRHARLRQALFRPDDMDNALLAAVGTEERDAEVAAVFFKLVDLGRGNGIDNRQRTIMGGNAVIGGSHSEIGTPYRQSRSRRPENAWGEVTS